MIFKLHYGCLTAGASAIGILMGVFMATYTDASSFEIGALYMFMPLMGLITRPIICSSADRHQAHQSYLITCLLITAICYLPFVIIPCLGPSLYEAHPRLCWYSLVLFKTLGDVAFGGVISIGDSLAINYANRIGTNFSVYRVWGTISWMVFGLLIGQINEVPFLPKYVPGFMILIVSTLFDMSICWLWPEDYFTMVAKDQTSKEAIEEKEKQQHQAKKENQFTKSLMPKEVVWAHAKGKLLSLICIGNRQSSRAASIDLHCRSAGATGAISDIAATERQVKTKREPISKSTQIKILALLLRRDPRIVLYLMYFACAGMSMVPMSFFFISLSEICHTQGTCNFSQLGGILQFSMASMETVLFIYVGRIKASIGRVNLAACSFLLLSIRYGFYGTYWSQVSPYYSIIAESLHGVMFGIFLTLMAELGHQFANEVEFIIPELIERGVVEEASQAEQLKLSLSATMQALISSAMDGVGRGTAALIYGIVLEHYTFVTLWAAIGLAGLFCTIITLAINLFDYFFDPQLGLDVAAKRKLAASKQLENKPVTEICDKTVKC